jgi:photosystem II stability/assembly factor-like uncharacterized protein
VKSDVRNGTRQPTGRTRRILIFVAFAVVLGLGALLGSQLAPSGTPPPEVAATGPVSVSSSTPLTSVACPTTDECVAVGGPGLVLLSQRPASGWTAVAAPTDHFLFGVACVSTTRCVAVGDAGAVVVSRNGLRHWSRVKSGTKVPLSSVVCQPSGTCFAVGDSGTVVATRDGGMHWESTRSGNEVIDGTSCGAPDQCVAVTSNAGQVLRTTDGTHWSELEVPGGPLLSLLPINGVACSSPTCVSVGVRGMIGRSGDGGASWSFDEQPATDQTLNDVSCSTPLVCAAVGNGGTILVTTDGGASFTQVASPTTQTLLSVSCPATGACVAVGDSGTVLAATAPTRPWHQLRGFDPTSAPINVLVVGDSFAHTVALYAGRNASSYGVNLIDGGVDGCSLARGDTLSLPVGGPCGSTGSGWPANYEQDVDQYRPALSLLVLGPWDLSARLIGGQWLSPGENAYDAYYAGQVATALQILSARGGRVAIATVPYVLMVGAERCAPPPTSVPNCPTEAERVQALDQIAKDVAAKSPGHVAVLDLGRHLAPKGTFTPSVDGVTVRAADGVHLSEPGGEWLAPWLLPQVVTAVRGST